MTSNDTDNKEMLKDTYVSLSQQGASLIHHVATPLATARANLDFLNRYLPVLLEFYRSQSKSDHASTISAEHLSAIERAPELINGQLDDIQARVKSHWQSLSKEVAGGVPNYQIAAPAQAEVLNKVISRPSDIKLLLVEDEEVHRDIARKILAPTYAIDTADSGESALNLCEKYNYDLILMDLYLPGINGQETAAAIRSSNHSHAVIIGLTNMPLGNQEEDDVLNAYLSKPLELEALNQCLFKIKKIST